MWQVLLEALDVQIQTTTELPGEARLLARRRLLQLQPTLKPKRRDAYLRVATRWACDHPSTIGRSTAGSSGGSVASAAAMSSCNATPSAAQTR
jgi:hypothetical protein